MSQIAYDLHMHSILSPCGDPDMTPNNIVGMAVLKELDYIALTDHNTAKNVPALITVAKREGLSVLPGIEVTTKEEAHVLTYFDSLEGVMALDAIIEKHLPEIPNRPDFFGHQYIMDEEDEIVGEVDRLLISATDLSIDALLDCVIPLGGIIVPAHIDRKTYSVMASLGFIPPELPIEMLEISPAIDALRANEKFRLDSKYQFIQSSDAHYLEDISERIHFLELEDLRKSTMLKLLGKSMYRGCFFNE